MRTTHSTPTPEGQFPRNRRRDRRRVLTAGLFLLLAWVVADLGWPVQSDIRSFDNRAISRIDALMWNKY
jgi:hypothetical protein